jgi:glycosyltransferase involved in cell wall biosynthesis
MPQQPLLYFGNIVTTTHDLTFMRFNKASRFPKPVHNFGMFLYRFLLWAVHRKSKKIIVPTQFVADDLVKYQPFTKDKIVLTYEAVDPLVPGLKSQKPTNVDKPFIFHVGAPLPHKNIQRLVEAFGILNDSQPELKLVLPGKMKPVFRNDLQTWIDASPAKDSVIVPGFISDEELKWLYENAECYVLPALAEGFGLPGLEAMENSCPLASSNATCLPEVYQDAALFFDPYNVEDIAEKVKAIINSPDLAQDLIAKGKKLLPRYSWRKMAEETLQVYNSTIR